MRILFLPLVIFFSGCATAHTSGYISRIDHSSERKIYGSFEKVVSSVNLVLKKQGFSIDSESDPSLYERDDRYDNNGYRNLLIITTVKKNYRIVYSAHARLNIFIHAISDFCIVEIRFEGHVIPQKILDAIEQEVSR